MIGFCMSPCSSDYLFAFASGARGRGILSSPPSRYTFRAPHNPKGLLHARLGSVLSFRFNTLYGTTERFLPNSPDYHLGPIMTKRKGQMVACVVCGVMSYRRPSHIKRGIKITCGSKQCRSEWMRGERNPYWGKTHSPGIRERMKAARRANPPKNRRGGRPPEQFTREERERMSARMKERWRLTRDKMIAALPRGNDHPSRKIQTERRYRIQFTRFQKSEWKGTQCFWCNSTDDLILDHIFPVMAGGKSVKENAQTLCRTCNLWKAHYVDRPLYLAVLGSQGG